MTVIAEAGARGPAHGLKQMRSGRPLTSGWPVRDRPIVSVLEEDPDLGEGLADDEFARAEQASIARAVDLSPGRWPFDADTHPGALGVLLLSGLALTKVSVGQRAHAELVSAGDVVVPWLALDSPAAVASSLVGDVVSPTRVVLLDRAFALRTAQWPEVASNLLGRAVRRARKVSQQAAVNAIPRIQERIEITLWLLADRFGRMTSDGVVLELPLTHSQLACLVGAQRPSVTTGLTGLQRSGRIERRGTANWLLRKRPESVEELAGHPSAA